MISHVISTGLIHNRYYRVYVTQVNKVGLESEKSEAAMIRVGDIEAPPLPTLALDTSYGVNGCQSNQGNVDVGVAWNTPVCDDLAGYTLYTWTKLPTYTGDGVYPKDTAKTSQRQRAVTNLTNNYVVTGCKNMSYVYIGIQAKDYSNNTSLIYVIRVLAEDTSVEIDPVNPCHAEPYGSWTIKVWTECPSSNAIASVVFYRDGWLQLPPVAFHSGFTAEYLDVLDTVGGLTHFYTYRYVDKNGHKSKMSQPSEKVTAKAIDTTQIDKDALEALRKAWLSENTDDIEALKQDLSVQAQKSKELAEQLAAVTEDYTKLYNKFTVAANNIELLSAKTTELDEGISIANTAIQQNADAISLRATKTEMDSATGQVHDALVSMIDVQAGKINLISSDLSGAHSNITQLSNQMQFKVDSNGLSVAIDMAIQSGISTAQITADRIVLNGQLLINNNARVVGKFYANDIALVNNDNSIAWGTGVGDIHPVVTDINIATTNRQNAANYNGWTMHRDTQVFDFTPRPRITFNGVCKVKVTYVFSLGFSLNGSAGSPPVPSSAGINALLSVPSEGDMSNARYSEGNINNIPITEILLNNFDDHYYHTTDKVWYYVKYDTTITRELMLPIGVPAQLIPWLRTFTQNTSYPGSFNAFPGDIWVWNRRMHIEVI